MNPTVWILIGVIAATTVIPLLYILARDLARTRATAAPTVGVQRTEPSTQLNRDTKVVVPAPKPFVSMAEMNRRLEELRVEIAEWDVSAITTERANA